MLATSLVLCAAVLHATWNTLVKFSSDRLLVVACMDVVGVLCAILLLPFVSLPPAEVWPWLLGATVLQLLYRVLLIEAYKVGDLGLVYPLMRGLSPLVVLGLTLAFGGEQLSGRQILGILLIPSACFACSGRRRFAAALADPAGGAADRPVHRRIHLERRQRPEALAVGAGLPGLADAALRPAVPADRSRRANPRLRPLLGAGVEARPGGRGLRVGQLRPGAVGHAAGSIAEAAALRETSVLLAVLFGMRFLNEPFGLPRLLACGLVLAGMLLMKPEGAVPLQNERRQRVAVPQLQGTAMTIAFWCVLIAIFLPYVCTSIAKFGEGYGGRANADPRAFLGSLEGFRRRANNAQLNAFEVTPAFAAAVIIAHLVGNASQATLDSLAIAWITSRLLYVICYLADWGPLRSLVWFVGMLLIAAFFVVSA